MILAGPAGFHLRWRSHNSAPAWLSTREIMKIDELYGITSTGKAQIEIQVPELHGFAEIHLVRDETKSNGTYSTAFHKTTSLGASLDIWTLTFSPQDYKVAVSSNFGGLSRDTDVRDIKASITLHHDSTTTVTLRAHERIKSAIINIPPDIQAFISTHILPAEPITWRSMFEKYRQR